MIIREFEPSDQAPLVEMLRSLPEEDRNFLKGDPDETDVVERWLNDPHAVRYVAVEDGSLVGEVAIVRGHGWSAHVGELELMVAPDRRRNGYGHALAERGLVEAVTHGLTHVFVEVAAEQAPLVAMFQRLGFEPEALLRDFIRDRAGASHDLIVLTHRVEQTWAEMLTLGIDDELEVR